jgi:hypothetical protein
MLLGTTLDPVTKRINTIVLGQTSFNDQKILESLIKAVVYGGTISVQQSDGTVDSLQLHEQEENEFDET